MKIAIMQPYFMPYIGYFQLINAVDQFVIYDDIQYTKKGWINRNRILVNGRDSYISLPLKKDSDYLDVGDRCLANSWTKGRQSMLNKLTSYYQKAPYFEETYPLVKNVVMFDNSNLFDFLLNSIQLVMHFIGINTTLIVSSHLRIDKSLKAQEKVINICKRMNASDYINPIGGIHLYNKATFKDSGINLKFLKTHDIQYQQFGHDFVPWLSVIDLLMFNTRNKVNNLINNKYELV